MTTIDNPTGLLAGPGPTKTGDQMHLLIGQIEEQQDLRFTRMSSEADVMDEGVVLAVWEGRIGVDASGC